MPGKKLLFFILMPIVVPLAMFINFTFDWWVSLSEHKVNKNRILFFLLLPIYAPLALLFFWFYESWAGLAG